MHSLFDCTHIHLSDCAFIDNYAIHRVITRPLFFYALTSDSLFNVHCAFMVRLRILVGCAFIVRMHHVHPHSQHCPIWIHCQVARLLSNGGSLPAFILRLRTHCQIEHSFFNYVLLSIAHGRYPDNYVRWNRRMLEFVFFALFVQGGASPLFAACQNGHFEVVERLLLREHIDVNLSTKVSLS